MPEEQTIEPALTEEEWRDAFTGHGCGHDDPAWNVMVEMERQAQGGSRHKTAALALHGQPFGFTWEDVDRLQGHLATLEKIVLIPGEDDEPEWHTRHRANIDWHRSLADRIESLLPPREG